MDMNFTQHMEESIDYLHKHGAFLTVKCGDIVNTMTIGWGNIGYDWNMPIFTVLVRKSRYTHDLIEKAGEFTVSIPTHGNLKEELKTCGTMSGRDFDKIKECNLKLESSSKISTPTIGNCTLTYECKIVYKSDMNPAALLDKIKNVSYMDNDYHTLYFGEIVNCNYVK